MKKIIATLLSLICAICCFGCFGERGKESSSTQIESTAKPSEYKLVDNGTTEYKILIPFNADEDEIFAAQELTEMFKKATGITLVTEKDTGIPFNNNLSYLSIGNTSLAIGASIEAREETVGLQGFVLKTVGKTVFMVGNQSIGSLYAVYEFLNRQFNYDCYARDELYIDTLVTNKQLLNFDMKEKPSFTYRKSGFTNAVKGDYAKRLRMEEDVNLIEINGNWNHNAIYCVLPNIYESTHPKWYDYETKDRETLFRVLCYTAHGDKTELDEMRRVVTEKLKECIRGQKNRRVILFGQPDTNAWCNCASCKAHIQANGNTGVSTLITFLKPIARDINEWLDQISPDREVKIALFAYSTTTREAPAVWDDNLKKYVPTSEDVRLEDNMIVYYAPIGAEYVGDFTSKKNELYYENLKKWSDMSGELMVWSYATRFNNYLSFYDNFGSMQKNYQLFSEYGVDYIMDQAQMDQETCTGFSNLKMWLQAKLSWNVNADYNKLLDNYFDKYFKQASEPMRQLFDEMHQSHLEWYNSGRYDGYLGTETINEYWYTREKVNAWEDLIDEAYNKIESLKNTDSVLYQKLHDRITIESITIRYVKQHLYGHVLGSNRLQEYRRALKNDITRLGFTWWWEGNSINNLIALW